MSREQRYALVYGDPGPDEGLIHEVDTRTRTRHVRYDSEQCLYVGVDTQLDIHVNALDEQSCWTALYDAERAQEAFCVLRMLSA